MRKNSEREREKESDREMQGVTERNRHNCKTDNEISGSEICDHQVETTQLRAGFTVLLVFIRKNGCLNVFLFRPIGSVRDLGPYLDRLKSKSLSAKTEMALWAVLWRCCYYDGG